MALVRVHDLTDWTDGADDAIRGTEYNQRLASLREQVAKTFMAAPKIPTVRLNSGYDIPILGLGTWKSSAEHEAENAVREALESGYRHIDCAKVYENETEVGKALDHCFKYGPVKREDVFVTSKLWIDSHAKEDVRKACVKSLSDLQLDYLDLYLIHWPAPPKKGPVLDPPIKETWLAMEKLVEEGLVRSVGISNFTVKKIQDLLEYCNIVPAVNQVELHPLLRQDELIQYCKEKGIHVTAYSPLGSPDSAPIFNRYVAPDLLRDLKVTAIAQKMGKDSGQILIRWGLQRDTSVLVKSSKPARIKSNLDVLDWELSEEDYQTLSSFDIQFRMLTAEILLSPEGPYRTLTELWDDPEEELRMDKYLKSIYTTDAPCPKTEIAPGVSMPLVGLGTWRSNPNEVKEAVLTAIRCGYRHIDCAEIYENEHEVGEALEQIFREGIVKREDLWITSKLWNTHHAKDLVLTSVQKSLSNLRLEYLDLYLIHFPVTGNVGPEVIPPIQETWQAMEGLVEQGLVRTIGVSNFSPKKLKSILSYATIKPAVCQVEIHPYFRNDDLITWCKEHGIHASAYSALGGAPETEQLVKRSLPKLLENEVLEEISQRIGKSKGQVLIKWALQHGTSVLAKSVKAERIKMNCDVHDWELSLADYNSLSSLEPQTRMLDGSFFINPNGPYTSVAQLWDE